MKKAVKFNFGGKEYNIRFNMNAIVNLEESLGKTLEQVKGESFTEIRAMVYSSIKELNTLEHAGDFIDDVIDEDKLEDLMTALMEALEMGLGKLMNK